MKQKLLNCSRVVKYKLVAIAYSIKNYGYRNLAWRLTKSAIRCAVLGGIIMYANHHGIATQRASLHANPDLLPPAITTASIDKTFLVTKTQGGWISGGSGSMIADDNGRIFGVTNAHVCQAGSDSGTMDLSFENGYSQSVQILSISREFDICILSPPSIAVPYFSMAKSYHMGDYVEAFGHPGLGPLVLSPGVVVSLGYMSTYDEDIIHCGVQTGEKITGTYCERTLRSIITNARTHPGSSGSPALNLNGEVIGLVYAAVGKYNETALVPLEDLRKTLNEYNRSRVPAGF